MRLFLPLRKVLYVLFFLLLSQLNAQENKFKEVWQNTTWADGAFYPSGPLWNMVGPYDFDQDGMSDFVASSSWSGAFLNGAYHYEATADNTIELMWWYHFAELDTANDNFSSVTVGDLDGDGNPEIIVLADARAGGDALQVFEWDADSAAFPTTPTVTWDLGLKHGVFEAGQIVAANLDSDDNQEVVVSVMDGPWGAAGTSHLMIFELQNKSFALPSWKVEMDDSLTTGWSGYTIYTTDLDNDELQEIWTVAWDYYRVIAYENTGNEDEYALQTAFYVSLNDEFSNQGLVAANFDNDGVNEMYATTSGGTVWGIAGGSDISKITFSNFNYMGFYDKGLRQIRSGDMDGDGKPDLYFAGNYDESVHDWEYNGGNPLDIASFSTYTIFMDDTTDDVTPGTDQGIFRVAKLFPGDVDNDGLGDMIVSSSSLALDKPTLLMLEYDKSTALGDDDMLRPQSLHLNQNYPNPFNPETQISYSMPQAGYVRLEIFDMTGRKIITLQDGMQQPGNYNYQWTGVDQSGRSVASGSYIYRLSLDGKVLSKKMNLLK
ncbi:MAG TPA: T9SS type A sorting domain-containing protein [Caldithrix abyssi]|uniref:T9SS type A sorting domain-containing protein n=1 Tax=Caldithrix abyssi TaxID=187145 RepID=A0A7V1LPB1_CALAY|nr:T9SS type A sorting domain-containing protein [Caldithrix abyssi]